MLVSERSFNKIVPPVPNKRKRKITLPYKHTEVCEMHNYWNEKNFMITDIVMHLIAESNSDNIPKTPKDIESIKTKATEEYLNFSLNNGSSRNKNSGWITEGQLKIKFPFLMKYGSSTLYQMIKDTSECIFNLKLGVKIYDETEQGFNYKPIQTTDNIFSFDCQTNRGTEKRILERKYQFKIDNSLLGYLMYRNIAFVSYDWIPDNFYELSKNSQNFFRRFISHRRALEKTTKIALSDIKIHQLYYYEDYAQIKAITIKSLEELKNNNLIEDFEIRGTRHWQTYINVTNILKLE